MNNCTPKFRQVRWKGQFPRNTQCNKTDSWENRNSPLTHEKSKESESIQKNLEQRKAQDLLASLVNSTKCLKNYTLLVGMQAGAAALENSMEVPQEARNRATLWASNCTSRYLPQMYKRNDLKGHIHPIVYSSNAHNSQTMERAKMPIDRWMDKDHVVYIHTQIIHTHTHYTHTQRETKHERLLTLGNKLRVAGGVVGGAVIGWWN